MSVNTSYSATPPDVPRQQQVGTPPVGQRNVVAPATEPSTPPARPADGSTISPAASGTAAPAAEPASVATAAEPAARAPLPPRAAPTEIPVNMLARDTPPAASGNSAADAKARLIMPKALYDSSWQSAPPEFGALKQGLNDAVTLHSNALRAQGQPIDETKLASELTLKMHPAIAECLRTGNFPPPINEDDVKLQQCLRTPQGRTAYDNIVAASRTYLQAHENAYGKGSDEVGANIKQAAARGETPPMTQGEAVANSEIKKLGLPDDTPPAVRGVIEGNTKAYYNHILDGKEMPTPSAETAENNLWSVMQQFGSRGGQPVGNQPIHQIMAGYTTQMKQQLAAGATLPPPHVLASIMVADRTEAGPRYPGLAMTAWQFLQTNPAGSAQ